MILYVAFFMLGFMLFLSLVMKLLPFIIIGTVLVCVWQVACIFTANS